MVAVTIIDYGIGNLRSVQKAFEKAGASPIISCRHEDIAAARALVLPGVGAFAEGMKQLRERGLIDPIRSAVRQGQVARLRPPHHARGRDDPDVQRTALARGDRGQPLG